MTAHARPAGPHHLHGPAADRQIAALTAALAHSRGVHVEAADAPVEDWRSDWDADRAAEKWENEVTRRWP